MSRREPSPRRPSNVMAAEEKKAKLNNVYRMMANTLLKFQSPTTGLFPLNTAGAQSHIGDIRTSIYSALSVWSLHLSYRKILSDDGGRTHLLAQTAVKTMRGILSCWMYQIPKMNEFLKDQIPKNALHVRFDLTTGEVLPDDDNYPQLQLDCISLYLLSLVQMIASGLEIIFTCDEVDFVQHLIYCIERAYRIADFGTWERGSKYNTGTPELNASNVGLAKAAMEAVNGFNLFGEHGASWTVVYVDIDAHMRNRAVFENLIPRESSSKSTDAALLPVLSWPCFAVHDAKVKDTAIHKIIDTLKGRHGFKRFLRDGYGTTLEDKNRQFYDASEIKKFDGIECEWPFLYFFLIIECMFNGDNDKAATYLSEIQPYLKETPQGVVVPQYYYVARDYIQAERDNPGGLHRLPTSEGTDEKYFLWGQSVYLVMKILMDNLLAVNELDPIKRYLSASERPRFSHRYTAFEASARDRLIQVAIIAESVRLQQVLATHGIPSQTPTQVEPVHIWSPNQLKRALHFMGMNYKLNLQGRPDRPVGLLGTSMFYRICGQTVICYPLLFEVNDFYISQDLSSVINQVQIDIEMLSNTWKLSGRPTYLIMVTENMVQSPSAKYLIDLLSSFKSGVTSTGLRVKLDRLQSMVSSGTKEHLDFLTHFNEQRVGHGELSFDKVQDSVDGRGGEIKVNLTSRVKRRHHSPIKDIDTYPDYKLVELYRSTKDLYEQSQSLKYLLDRCGPDHVVDGNTLRDLLENIRFSASQTANQDWSVVRLCSALTGKLTDSLSPSVTNILVRGKLVTVGVFGNEETVISKPINPFSLGQLIYKLCLQVEPREAVLQQEMILILGQLHSSKPQMFDGILKIRIGWILQAMQFALNYDTPDASIFSLSPSEISDLLNRILKHTKESERKRPVFWRRRLLGSLGSLPRNFYDKMWYILQRTPEGIQLYSYHIPQYPTLSDLTVQEMNFALLIEEMLSVIRDPVYRQVVVEVLMVVAVILERNPEVNFTQTIDVCDIFLRALSYYRDSTGSKAANEDEVRAEFYQTPTDGKNGTHSFIAKAACSILLDNTVSSLNTDDCCVM